MRRSANCTEIHKDVGPGSNQRTKKLLVVKVCAFLTSLFLINNVYAQDPPAPPTPPPPPTLPEESDLNAPPESPPVSSGDTGTTTGGNAPGTNGGATGEAAPVSPPVTSEESNIAPPPPAEEVPPTAAEPASPVTKKKSPTGAANRAKKQNKPNVNPNIKTPPAAAEQAQVQPPTGQAEPPQDQPPVEAAPPVDQALPADPAAPAPVAQVKVEDKVGADAIPAGQELVNIDFPEPTEIRDIIKAVTLWTGKNVIIDRNVSGKIQIISPKKTTKEEAYQAFLSALNLLGYTTVETGKVIKIMQIRVAVRDNLKTFLGTDWTPLTDEIITQIVPLKYINAQQIQTTLSRIVSPNSIVPYQPTNTLIISDSGYKVKRVLDIIKLLDVQGQQPQVAIVPIRFTDANSVAEKVREILSGVSAKRGGAASQSNLAYKILVDERSNSVVIFGPPRTIADVKELVRKFDIELEDPASQSTIHVRPLDYADAKKLAATLSSLATGSNKGGGAATRRAPIRRPDGTPEPSGSGTVAELDDNVKITADESANALLITGSRSAYRAVNSIVRKLDIQRSQVFVEADILDINMGDEFRAGTSIFAGAGSENGTKVVTSWEAGKLGPLLVANASQNKDAKVSESDMKSVAGAFANDLTIGVISGKKINVPGLGEISPGALISLIKTDANTRILSSPHILTANNEKAKITAGQKIFFYSSETSATGVTTPKVERESADLSMEITPNISTTNYVTLKIDIDASSFGGLGQNGLPEINTRRTSQLVTVKNNQTIVVSGLVSNTELETFKKIPLLGDIPILGWLFRNSNVQKKQTNLVVFLTPHVVHGADDLAAIYSSKIADQDAFLEKVYGSGYKDDDFYARIPQLEDGQFKPDATDEAEKSRREAMLREMREDQEDKPLQRGNNAEKMQENDPITVPLGGSDDGGGSTMMPPPIDGGGDMEPPPPPPDDLPPPEPAPPPEG